MDCDDKVFIYNKEQHQKLVLQKPWVENPHYFQNVKISLLALHKMARHAACGGDIEVMGLLQGKIEPHAMIVLDVFALPVEGTETRVNAHEEGYEYMVEYLNLEKEVGGTENVIGWYHSHPGYGCWLSGIDVETQQLNQKYQEPWLAIVQIDPHHTLAQGKVEMGAFRTVPEGEYQSGGSRSITTRNPGVVPVEKVEDFGMHANKYYSLTITYFSSPLDRDILCNLPASEILGFLLDSKSSLTYCNELVNEIDSLEEKLFTTTHQREESGDGSGDKERYEEILAKNAVAELARRKHIMGQMLSLLLNTDAEQ